jgi:hypothetical protein
MKTKLLLIAVLAFVFCSAIQAQTIPNYVPSNGLVGWWPFNGNANDESGNGNDGTVNGATLTEDRFGVANAAYDFDGVDDLIDLNFLSQINGASSVSINGWFRTSDLDGTFLGHWINNGQPTGPIGITLTFGSQNLFYLSTNGGSGVNTINDFDLDLWSMISVVYDGSLIENTEKLKIYLNGNLQQIDFGSALLPSTLGTTANSTYLGAKGVGPISPNGIGGYLDGSLDDIGIWNRTLSEQELSNLYNAGLCNQYITVTDTLVINTNITSFNPITYENVIKIWPNPAGNQITIDNGDLDVSSGYQIKINNSLGQQMFQSIINQQQFSVDLSTWTGNGLYFVHIIDPQGNIIDIRKIVLQ